MSSRRFSLDLPDVVDLGKMKKGAQAAAGIPLQLQLDAVDEDPNQPRTEFDTESLQELADSIRERGVRQPVSVKPHPAVPGRYVLNFGARRLRASRMAGKETIPAFVDETANDFDQVAENEQRQGLTPMELALFVKRKTDEGLTPTVIAQRLGKSKSMVSYALALVDAPDWIMEQYRSGKCRGLRELYELRKLHQEQPAVVEQQVAEQQSVTRSTVESLKGILANQGNEFDGQTLQLNQEQATPTSDQFDGQTAAIEFDGQTAVGQTANASASAAPFTVPEGVVEKRLRIAGRPVVFRADGKHTLLQIDAALLPPEKWTEVEKALRKVLG
jgi:ParB family chromosome partitioning protein